MAKDVVTLEAANCEHFYFCVDAERTEALADLDSRKDVPLYEELTDDCLKKYLDKKTRESKKVISLEDPALLAANESRANMDDPDAK